jgi:hypothetical protein
MIPFVSVIWKDAWSDSGDGVYTKDVEENHGPVLMETIGWLLKDDDQGVSVFNERCVDKGDDFFRSRTFIPKLMIVSVTPIKISKPRKARREKVHPSPPANADVSLPGISEDAGKSL